MRSSGEAKLQTVLPRWEDIKAPQSARSAEDIKMATSATATANVNPNLKPQTANWGVQLVTTTKKDGTTEPSLKAIQGDALINKAREDGSLQFEQTFGYDFPVNDAGQKEIIPDDEGRNDVFIAGLKASRIGPRIRRELEEYEIVDGVLHSKFEQREGVWDFRELIREAAERKNLTPMEKALKNLRNIPVFANMSDEQLMGFLDKAALEAAGANSENQLEAENAEADAATV